MMLLTFISSMAFHTPVEGRWYGPNAIFSRLFYA